MTKPSILVFLFHALLGGLAAEPITDPPSHVFLSSGVFASIVEVEIATGNRRLIDLDDYPRIIKATDFAVETEGTLLIETVDAAQRKGIYRFDPSDGSKQAISGGVDGFQNEMLGNGPSFDPSLNTLIRTEDGIAVLRDFEGPMHVNLSDGDRTVYVLNDPTSPPLMARPDDMVLLNRTTLLVADRFSGLLRVDLSDGTVRKHFESDTGAYTPRRMDLLPDGRLVYVIRDPDAAVLWSMSLTTGVQSIYSGTFGGKSVGKGDAFQFAYDVMVDSFGRVYVFDAGALALIEVTSEGTRRVVSSPELGNGYAFFTADDQPILGTWQRSVPAFSAWSLK